jgi:hypothetical protein
MPGFMPRIHVLKNSATRKTWVAGIGEAKATPFFKRLRPAMTNLSLE